jgi:hypothetical protein
MCQGEQLPNETTEFLGSRKPKKRDAKRGGATCSSCSSGGGGGVQEGGEKDDGVEASCSSSDSSDDEWFATPTRSAEQIARHNRASSTAACGSCNPSPAAVTPVKCDFDPAKTSFFPMHPSCGLCGCPACPSSESNELHDKRSATVVLPYYTKKEVYTQYCNDFLRYRQTDEHPISDTLFYTLWKKELAHIKVSRAKSGWAKCNECDHLRKMMDLAGNSHLRQRYRDCYEDHLRHQRRQRIKYYKHRRKAIDRPDDYLSIILDAMDQKKTEIPHQIQFSKQTQDALRLRQKLMGSLVHGVGMFLHLLSPPLKAGGNFSAHCLLETLKDVGDLREAEGLRRLPPTLYLQLDNASDNKNRCILALCDSLVTKGVFKKIKISFLLVGHTHEDVDQYFRYEH